MLKIGNTNELKVIRKTDLGYILTDDEVEVFLHFRQTDRELKPEERITVFLLLDSQKRVTATMTSPIITTTKLGLTKVVSSNDFGIFVDNNTFRDVLIPKSELPSSEYWPKVDEEVAAILQFDGSNLFGRFISKSDLLPYQYDYSTLSVGDTKNALVIRKTSGGLHALTDDYGLFFIPNQQYRGIIRIGEHVEVTVTAIHDGEYVGSLSAKATQFIPTDEETIIAYLKNNNGTVNFTAKSESEEIANAFGISRKAFKRALGSLYRKRVIECNDDSTTLL